MLQRINEQEVCDAVGLCSETLNKIPAVYHSSQPQDVQCEFCEKVRLLHSMQTLWRQRCLFSGR